MTPEVGATKFAVYHADQGSLFYRSALWLPAAVPALLAFAGLVVEPDPSAAVLIGLASIFGIGLAAYAPFGLYLAYKARRTNMGEAGFRKFGRAIPLFSGLLIGVCVTAAAGLEGEKALGGGVLLALLTAIFGYGFVALVELGFLVGKACGWLYSSEDQPESQRP